MSLAEREVLRKIPGRVCSIRWLLERFPADAPTLLEWLADDANDNKSIAANLQAEFGFEVEGHTVKRHRAGGCKC